MKRTLLSLALFLVILASGVVSCQGASSPIIRIAPAPQSRQAWLDARAADLNLSPDQTTSRDKELDATNPPAELWDDIAVRERAGHLWASMCASCHGARGQLEEVPTFDPPPRPLGGFGMFMGFTMGGDKMRGGIFKKIKEGGQLIDGKQSAMPAFESLLSNEQIWALVYYIEHL